MIEHSAPVSGVDIGCGPYAATAGYDGRLILWELATKRPLSCAFHDHLVNQCQFSPDGHSVVSASSDYTARRWSVPDLRLLEILGDHQDDVEMAAFDPSGTRIATACRDHSVRLFEVNGRLLRRLEGHAADVLSVSWTAAGETLISSGDDGTVRRWDADGGRLLSTMRLSGVETDTLAVDASGTIYAGNDHGEILQIQEARTRSWAAHDAGIKRLVLDAERRWLISTSYDRTAKLWRLLADGGIELLRSILLPPLVWARSCAVEHRSPASRILFGTFGSSYAVYDPGVDTWDMRGIRDTYGVNAVCCFDGAVYSVGDAGIVQRDGVVVARMGSLCNFFVALDGCLLTGGHMGTLMDAASGRVLYRHRSPLNCATRFRMGDTYAVLVGAYTGEGIVLRGCGGGALEVLTSIPLHDQSVKGVAANDDHIFSVSAGSDCAVWRVPGLQPIVRVRRAHDQIANGVTALPDGRFASVSRDRRLRLWCNGAATVIATPHDHSIKCVSASASGSVVATGSYDGKIGVFDLKNESWVIHHPTVAGISALAAGPVPDALLASSYKGEIFVVDAIGVRPVGSG